MKIYEMKQFALIHFCVKIFNPLQQAIINKPCKVGIINTATLTLKC
jgi:hypothetical protein